MLFSDLMKDKISIIKSNGEVFKDIQASVQKKKTFINRSDILIETGDLIKRNMSNGATEIYKVVDPGFHESFDDIPAGYQIIHENIGLPKVEKVMPSISTYNLNGNNTRVNNNSTDNSTNIININKDVVHHISMLKKEVMLLVEATSEQNGALEIVDAIEKQFKSDKPSKHVLKILIDSLPGAGSIASIGSFLLSCVGGS